MSYRILFILNAFFAVVVGLAMVFVPAMVLDQFGAEGRVPELLLARFIGVVLVTVGLVLWFAKDAADEKVQKNIGMGLLIGAVLGLIVTILGIAGSGVIRSNGWIAILVSVLFGLGYGFLLFLKPRVK
jgi:heme/copper-type cytochrome/quinol oxidase subunit 3